MNKIKKLPFSYLAIITAGVFLSAVAYIFSAKLDPIYILYVFGMLASIFLFIKTPKMVASIMIILVQLILVSSLTYSFTFISAPNNALWFTLAAIAYSIVLSVGLYYKALGRYWVNLATIFALINVNVVMSLISRQIEEKILYIILLFLTPVMFVLIKNSILNRKIIKPYINKTNTSNTVLHKNISKMLQKENISSRTKNGFITRYILSGDKILFIYEPPSTGKSEITKNGLKFEGQDYSAFLEELIKASIEEANRVKINKNNIMPIVIVHDYKGKNILSLRVYSKTKPDVSIGSVYVCSPQTLIKLYKNLKVQSKLKVAEKTKEKYSLLFS